MTVLAVLPVVEETGIPADVEAAIREHLTTGAPVRPLLRKLGVSKTTFYRYLPLFKCEDSSPEALTPSFLPDLSPQVEMVECALDCGVFLSRDCSDAEYVTHLVTCSKASDYTRWDAEQWLRRHYRQSRLSTTSELPAASTPEPSNSSTSSAVIAPVSAKPDPIEDDWSQFAANLKTEQWGEREPEVDPFYDKFSPVTGEVYDDWSMAEWAANQTAGIKPFGTAKCRTATRHGVWHSSSGMSSRGNKTRAISNKRESTDT